MKKSTIIGLITIFTIAIGCSRDPLAVSIDQNPLTINYYAVDSLLQQVTPNNAAATLNELNHNIPDITAYQFAYCWQVGLPEDPSIIQHIQQFQALPHIQRIEKALAKKFTDLPKRHQSITDGFKRLSVHFPSKKSAKINQLFVFQFCCKCILYRNGYCHRFGALLGL